MTWKPVVMTPLQRELSHDPGSRIVDVTTHVMQWDTQRDADGVLPCRCALCDATVVITEIPAEPDVGYRGGDTVQAATITIMSADGARYDFDDEEMLPMCSDCIREAMRIMARDRLRTAEEAIRAILVSDVTVSRRAAALQAVSELLEAV